VFKFELDNIIETYEYDQILSVLKNLGKDWNFDMFFIQECT
jgi:hypothetical protein